MAVYFGGSRKLTSHWSPFVGLVVSRVLAAGQSVHVGCQLGADALVVSQCAIAAPSSLVVFAVAHAWAFASGHIRSAFSAGARDLAIIAFGLDTGFRRAELCSVELKNVDFYTGTAAAICKGGQWGYGAFGPETNAIVQRWLAFRKPAEGVDALFTGAYDGKPLTGDGFACIFKRLSQRLGFKISAHDLRSSHATFAKIFGASDYAGMLAGRWKTQQQYHHYIGTLKLNVIRPHLPMTNLLKQR